MRGLKYTIIKSEEQYFKYCDILEKLVLKKEGNFVDEIELLDLLIEKWDRENVDLFNLDPIRLLKYLMDENNLRAKDLVGILRLSKGTISKILNYHKGLSKETIRKLSVYFKVSQEAFNRPYKIINPVNRHFRNANLMNTQKDMGINA